MKPVKLSRRIVLRGAGLSVALPVLDAMLDSRGLLHGSARAAGAAIPVRMFAWTWGNGTKMKYWNPSGAEGDLRAVLPQALEPLKAASGKADLVGDVNLVTKLNHKQTVGNGAHDGVFIFTGAKYASRASLSGYPLPSGPSIDAVAAAHHKATSKNIAVSADIHQDPINWTVMSWNEKGEPVTPYRNPATLFDRLFAGESGAAPSGPSPSMTASQMRKSVLDFVLQDATRLQASLGALDRERLDQHLTSIREVERQVAGGGAAPAPGCGRPMFDMTVNVSSTDGAEQTKRARVLAQLFVHGLKCDLIRFGTFNFQNSDGMQKWPGIGRADHSLSHEYSEDVLNLKITQYKMEELAYLLRLMKSVNEGSGTLLDNSIVLASSEIGEGASHNTTDLPVLLAGRAGGALQAGRYLNRSGRNYNDMLCSMLRLAGVPVDKYGEGGTGALNGV